MRLKLTERFMVLPLAVALVLSSCSKTEIQQTEVRAVPVQVEVLQASDQRVLRTFTGSLEGERQADIYAKIAEAVEKVHVREGQTVTAGQVLVSLDKTGPSSMYRTTESVFRNAEKNFGKMEYLYKEGAISESQFDGAKTEYEVAKADFDAAARLVDIQSPISGVVTSLDVSPGDYLYTGEKLATVARVDRLRARFGVNPRDIDFFRKGAAVTVAADEVGKEVTGEVVSVASSADPSTRAFQVEVEMDNSEGFYRPGMFVRVSAIVNELESVLVIPRAAVLTLEGRQTVFVVEGDTAHKREVTLGHDLNGHVVITAGLKAGDTLITLGQNYVDEGFRVKITAAEVSGR